MSPRARWQALLYGRTARADRWWRLRPYDVDIDWLNAVVVACTGGGEGLADHERFLLARRGPLRLVGVACRAGALSATMNSDGSRPFYTFVGWITQDLQAPAPTWGALRADWSRWSGEVYDAWMPLDWDKHRTDLGDGHESPFVDAPWAAAAGTASHSEASAQARATPPAREGTILMPADAAPQMWLELSVAAFDFAFVVGFERPPANVDGYLTHATVASIDVPAIRSPRESTANSIPPQERPETMTSPPERKAAEHTDTHAAQQRLYDEQTTRQEDANRGASPKESQYDQKSRPGRRDPEEGLLQRARRFVLPHNDEVAPREDPRPPVRDAEEEAKYGPMKDLDYWTARDKPARPDPGERRKQRPPENDS